jgi:hypothetical protein
VTLEWSQRSYTKTIQLDPEGNNVGTMWSSPGISIALQVVEYMNMKFPYISFATETIDIIQQDPYDPTTDEDDIPIDTRMTLELK